MQNITSGLIHDNFLLNNETAKTLFHNYAKNEPIFDYHCHLVPQEIYENKPYENITQMWLAADHYKWRLMRNNGIAERFITGDADDYDKFRKFISCLQYAAGHPLYHWCHLELKRYFDIDEICCDDNADIIWKKTLNRGFTPQALIEMSNVAAICTTDKPDDTLEYHEKLSDLCVKILPTFRPDITGDLPANILSRIEYFHNHGCRLSDHAIDTWDGKIIENLIFLGKEYQMRGWTMQLHIGALRNTNSTMFSKLGVDTGFDSINDMRIAENLVKVLDGIGGDVKTILYSLNPNDNSVLATMTGNFRNVRHGSAWWFNDTYEGMREQMKTLASNGALNKFLGMLTDSRSFLSYTRHEYFRRILCNLLGEWIEHGLYPNNEKLLAEIISDICYNNAVEFIGFPE